MEKIKAFFAANRLAVYAGLALLLGIVLLLAYCQGRSDGRTGEVVKQQGREIETQIDLGKAGENAASARVGDATRAEQQKGELSNALASSSDPDARRRANGCAVLRQQGRDTSGIPACR